MSIFDHINIYLIDRKKQNEDSDYKNRKTNFDELLQALKSNQVKQFERILDQGIKDFDSVIGSNNYAKFLKKLKLEGRQPSGFDNLRNKAQLFQSSNANDSNSRYETQNSTNNNNLTSQINKTVNNAESKITQPIYADDLRLSNPKKIEEIINELLKVINNNYCALIKMDKSSTKTPILTKSQLTTSNSTFFKDSNNELLEKKQLQDNLIAIGKPKNFSSSEKGQERLAKLLDQLKKVTTVEGLLTAIYNAGCFQGTNLPKAITPIILQMYFLRLKPSKLLESHDTMELKDRSNEKVEEKNNNQIIDVATANIYNHNPVYLASLICQAAAGKLDPAEQHTVQQTFCAADTDKFEGDIELYQTIQRKLDGRHQFGI